MNLSRNILSLLFIVALFGCKLPETPAEKNLKTWSKGDKEVLVRKCMEGFSFNDENGPKIAEQFCDCSVQKAMEALTFEKYISVAENGMEDQSIVLAPIIKDCKDQLDKDLAAYNKVTK